MTEKWTTIVADHTMDFGHDTRQFIITTEDGDEIARTSGFAGQGHIDEARAHLIAAAPDLLEAAETALDATHKYCVNDCRKKHEYLVLEAAIAKAKGDE